MFASPRKRDAVHDAVTSIYGGPENPADLLVDYTRPVHPTDRIEDRVRQEYLDRHANKDPYPPQEFVACLNTGRSLNPEMWRERQDADARLVAQTDALVAALERTGVSATGGSDVWAVGEITGAIEKLNGYRSICFLPLVAQRDRRPMLNELRYFRKQHRPHGRFMRYGVVTNGPTVAALGMPPVRAECEPKTGEYFELRCRIQKLARTVSRFADWARDKYDIDVVYRGTEFTVERRGDDDGFSVHPHVNVLYTPRRKLSKREWESFLSEASDQLDGWWWKDCGVLKDPNEAIKYAFKPVETDPEKIGDAMVRWLFEQTFGLKMAQPMGAFMHWRHDVLSVQEWFDESAQAWTLKSIAGARRRRRKHRKVVMFDYAKGRYSDGPSLGICSVRRRPGSGRHKRKTIIAEDAPRPENVVMGYTMPQRRFSPFAERNILIMGYTPSPVTEFGREALCDIARERDRMLPVWSMNGAPDPQIALALGRGQAAAREGEAANVVAFSVHTRSSTAGRGLNGAQGRGPPVSISLGCVPDRARPAAFAGSGR